MPSLSHAAPEEPVRMAHRLLFIVGAILVFTGAAMLIPTAMCLLDRQWTCAFQVATATSITGLVGLVTWKVIGRPGELTTREGFAAVALSWIAMSVAGTLPYLLTGSIDGVVDAFFETVSGFTTTGSSILADPAELPRGILLWRALTEWIGGMGMIVLSIAILPMLGVGSTELARAESAGPQPDRLTPRFRDTAKRLWMLYIVFTIALAVFLALGDMDLFEAVTHSLTTISTGGFSTEAGSLGAFNAYSQWVVIAFMLVGGTSFALHYRALLRPDAYARSGEFRLYGGLIALGVALMVGGLLAETSIESARIIRGSVFTAVTAVTGTGFATEDFGVWPQALQVLLITLLFVGGMAGSTTGGLKVYRLGVLTKAASADLRRLIQPRAVIAPRFGGETVSAAIAQNVQSFFILYVFAFAAGAFVVSFLESIFGQGADLTTTTSAAAAALNNFGPGLGDVGPASTYAHLTSGSKLFLTFLMFLGRLEIFPVLLLFRRDLWRR